MKNQFTENLLLGLQLDFSKTNVVTFTLYSCAKSTTGAMNCKEFAIAGSYSINSLARLSIPRVCSLQSIKPQVNWNIGHWHTHLVQ